MRVRVRCAVLDSLLIGVHLGSPAAMNAATPLRSRRHFSPPSSNSFPVRLPSPKCCLSLKAVGGIRCHGTVRHWMSGALTDYGHFDNLAFFKSPLQSVVNYFPSQFITSCLIWTCLAYTNCNCLFFLGGGGLLLPQLLYHWKMNHPQTSRGQT